MGVKRKERDTEKERGRQKRAEGSRSRHAQLNTKLRFWNPVAEREE